MKLIFFVKDDCGACKNAKEKVSFFLSKWGVADLDTETVNLSTSDGLVEAAMRAVGEIPTIILEDQTGEVARWMKQAPASEDLKAKIFKNMSERAATLIKEDMEYMGPVRVTDVEAAQERIVAIARRLEAAGEVVISGRPGADEVIV